MTPNIPELLRQLLPLLIPLIILQLGLMIYSLADLARRETTRGPKWMWVILVVIGQLWGPVLYLLVGRKEA